MASANGDMDIHADEDEEMNSVTGQEPELLVQVYQPIDVVPDALEPHHRLLRRQPAVLGSVQMVSGLLSVGFGVIFAVTQDMSKSLCTLFRVCHMTGLLFILAGLGSNLLHKYPKLLPACLMVNIGCIATAAVAVCCISVDLASWDTEYEDHLWMEVIQLCVLALEVFLSFVLCAVFYTERRC